MCSARDYIEQQSKIPKGRMKTIICSIGLLIASFAFPSSSTAQPDAGAIPYGNNASAGRTITVDGVRLYYEVYGKGRPLVLIHGNGGSIAYMKPQIEYFAQRYRVFVMDCRGRGKSELGKDSLSYLRMTEDIVAILDQMQADSAYVVGRSDGGILALMLAIHHPEKVRKVAAFAANLTPDTTALYPFFYHEVAADRRQADVMLAAKDTSKNWKLLQQRNRLMEFQPQISKEQLQRIQCPVLVLSTDRDIIPEEHTLFIYRSIPKANLCIFTGENHYMTSSNPVLFNSTVARFFENPFRGEDLRR